MGFSDCERSTSPACWHSWVDGLLCTPFAGALCPLLSSGVSCGVLSSCVGSCWPFLCVWFLCLCQAGCSFSMCEIFVAAQVWLCLMCSRTNSSKHAKRFFLLRLSLATPRDKSFNMSSHLTLHCTSVFSGTPVLQIQLHAKADALCSAALLLPKQKSLLSRGWGQEKGQRGAAGAGCWPWVWCCYWSSLGQGGWGGTR